MPRLLLIAYYFEPVHAAAIRMGQVADNLPKFGWEVSVLTRPWDGAGRGAGVIRTKSAPALWLRTRDFYRSIKSASALKRAAGKVLSAGSFPDRSIWWIPVAMKAALQSGEHFDAIMTSHGPSAEHLIGSRLSKALKIPWIADYQDLWTGNGIRRPPYLLKAFDRWLERRSVRSAAAITCCKESFAAALRKIHATRNGPRLVTTIPFACDVDAWETVPDVRPSEFRLCYAGGFCPGHSSPDLLFGTIAKLKRRGAAAGLAARFDYFGPSGEFVMQSARRHGISDVVRAHGVVDRRSVMSEERASALLVTILNEEGTLRLTWTPSKLYEYAGAKRHLLGVGPKGSAVEEFIVDNGLGFYASDEESCGSALERSYKLFCEEHYEPTPHVSGRRLLSPTEVAGKFATILNTLVT